MNFSVTHEKIIVPVEPIEKETKVEKPVTELAIESNVNRRPKTKYSVDVKISTSTAATPVKRSASEGFITRSPTRSTQAPIRRSSSGLKVWTTTSTPLRSSASLRVWSTTPAPTLAQPVKRNPRNYDDGRGNYQISHEYSNVAKHPQQPAARHHKQQSRNAGPNQIQPLHIDTDIFKKKHAMSSGSLKPTKHQQEKIQLHNLPKNPGTDIPATDWFDNLGKYHYGIVHDELYFTEPPEYAVQTQKPHGKVIESTPAPPPPQVFRSSFRDPQFIPPIIQPVVHNDHLGKFLYKTEVHYPTYRNHLYPPVTIYGDHAAPKTKELPVPSVHPIPPPPGPPRKGESDPPPQSKQQQEDEEDYDEDSSEDYDDGTGNDKYDGDPPGDDDEEQSSDDESGSEEKDDKPKYRYGSGGSSSGESDEFERAWSKYGYGKGNKDSGSDESRSYESSETRNVPQRVKFFHEVKEEVTTPYKQVITETPPKRIKFYHEVKEEISTPRRSTTTEAPVKLRRITKVVSGKLNHSKFKTTTPKMQPKPKAHPTVPPKSVKSQNTAEAEEKSQRSDAAGSDDLKFFQ